MFIHFFHQIGFRPLSRVFGGTDLANNAIVPGNLSRLMFSIFNSFNYFIIPICQGQGQGGKQYEEIRYSNIIFLQKILKVL